ncbi:MAG TPA: hypothetical protein VM509_01530 [Planctomycetota bacterium]|nr:hypothetical protein [Planctomycetota bacterium]
MEPSASWRWRAPRGRAKRGRVELLRRGVRHGSVELVATLASAPDDLDRRFQTAHPIHLRGWLPIGGVRARARIEATRRWFERLRAGESFSAGVRARLARQRDEDVRVLGVSEDVADAREIEKVHVALASQGRAGADLYAKLSWIADDERDDSLRVRFSFGAERSSDWKRDPRRALAADRLAELVFPECALIARHHALFALLERLCGGPVRLSERIVYNNAPGGGASFHHDGETRQLGVVYGQLSGSTGWLALPRDELAQEIAAFAQRGPLARGARTAAQAARALDGAHTPAVTHLLDLDPRLTRRLVERGAFFRLQPGDLLILPSPRVQVCAWHSVFALGRRASVAHSYGLFLAREKQAR